MNLDAIGPLRLRGIIEVGVVYLICPCLRWDVGSRLQ